MVREFKIQGRLGGINECLQFLHCQVNLIPLTLEIGTFESLQIYFESIQIEHRLLKEPHFFSDSEQLRALSNLNQPQQP